MTGVQTCALPICFPVTIALPSLSIPKLRTPAEDEKKNKSEDWAAQGVKEKQEAAKKKQQEDAAQAEAKAQQMAREEQSKSSKKTPVADPAISRSSTDALVEADKAKLPAVTGIDGVKPRAANSGGGRVQPGFDSFTGPSTTSPMGKDYQSGAKPIMPPANNQDGRMMVPPKAPEPLPEHIRKFPKIPTPCLCKRRRPSRCSQLNRRWKQIMPRRGIPSRPATRPDSLPTTIRKTFQIPARRGASNSAAPSFGRA